MENVKLNFACIDDFYSYTDSTMILDQSGRQQINFIIFNCEINVYNFFEGKKIKIVATTDSANEFYEADKKINKPDLFSEYDKTSATVSSFDDGQSYVFSQTNGSLTRKELDYSGCSVEIVAVSKESQTTQSSLWDIATPISRIIRKVERKKRGNGDKSNIYLARNLKQQKKNFFLLANDQDQIEQFEIEGYKYLRPTDLLVWMVLDEYVKKQKAVCTYEKIVEKDPRWTKKDTHFKNLLANHYN